MKIERWSIKDADDMEVGQVLTGNNPMEEFAEESGIPVKLLRQFKFSAEIIPVSAPMGEEMAMLDAFQAALKKAGFHVS